MLLYEFSLMSLGLKNYVFYGPRTDFISANREGVVSSSGYLAVCLFGIEVGRKVFQILYEKEGEGEKEVKVQGQKGREYRVLVQLIM
jgi:hypothetical protein